MSTPHKCPVCEGRGTVPHNFYSGAIASSSIAPETCRSCKGEGVLWSNDIIKYEIQPAFVPDIVDFVDP